MAFEWLTSAFSSAAPKRAEDLSFEEARPVFFKAIKTENFEMLDALSKKFPDALGWENDKGTPLFIALRENKLGSFKRLIGLGADLQGNSGDLLELSAMGGKKDFAQFILEQGVSNTGSAEYYARSRKNFDIADMLKRKDIIRAEYLAKNPQPAPAPATVAPAPDMTTDSKIELLSPVQLKKTPDAATP
jgi:hypothetical protein